MITALLSNDKFRFLIAGGSAALLNWLARFPLSSFLPYTTALLAAQAIGMAYGFVIYRNWVFTSSARRGVATELLDFIVVNAAGAAVTIATALILQAGLLTLSLGPGISEAIAHAGGIAAGAAVNFVGHKFLTFRPSSQRQP